MSKLLSRSAVGTLSGAEATEILQEYLNTGPGLAFSHTPAAPVAQQPSGTAAGDKLIKPR